MRRTDSSIATLASGELKPPALQPQQRRDRLQVVLHPVVDLADRRVLRQQQPVPAAQLGDVADEHDRPGHRAVVEQRDAADQHRHVRRPLDLLGDRRPHGERRPHEALVEPELAEAQPLGVGVDADAVQGRHGVRRRVLDAPGGVEQDHAVADARGLLALARPRAAKGNSPAAIMRAKRLKIST